VSTQINKGDKVTVKYEVTGKVTYVGGGDYIEATAEDNSVHGFNTGVAGVTVEVHAPSALEQFKALNPGDKFRLEGSGYYSSNSVRVKINDEMYFNTNTNKTVKVMSSTVLHDKNAKVVSA